MSVLAQHAALICVAAGVITGMITVLTTGNGLAALRIAMDFWIAASLLRLSSTVGWQPLVVAAAIMAVRQLIGRSIRHPAVRFADLLPRRSSHRSHDAA